MVLSVKGGQHIAPTDARDLYGTLQASLGGKMAGMILQKEPTKGMKEIASTAGQYKCNGVLYNPKQFGQIMITIAMKLKYYLSFIFLSYLFIPLAEANGEIGAVHTLIETQTNLINNLWLVIAIFLVFSMQGGFLLLEAGIVRSKNSINVAQKNIIDFLLAVFAFYIFGFAIMFGFSENGFFGWEKSFFLLNDSENSKYFLFFLFHAAFAGTASTIVSGAVAERMKLHHYMILIIFIAIFIYPVVGHWIWGNLIHAENSSFFIRKGFIDFAGATVVHSTGAWVALAACIILGPRLGRYDPETGNMIKISSHNLVLSTLGCIILWMGWIGFNGGSTSFDDPRLPNILMNTMLSPVLGGITALLVGKICFSFFRPEQVINGILGGLVAITAGAHVVSLYGTVIIGISAGFIVIAADFLLTKYLKIDDPVGAIPVHGFCGVWGTIALAFFMKDEFRNGLSMFQQFFIQLEGAVIVFIWVFSASYIFCYILNNISKIRVSEDDEENGLNLSEHGESFNSEMLWKHFRNIVSETHDLTQRIDVDKNDESGKIANHINEFLENMQSLIKNIGEDSKNLTIHSNEILQVSSILDENSNIVFEETKNMHNVNSEMKDYTSNTSHLVQEMNARIHEILSSTNQTADNIDNISNSIVSLTASIADVAKESNDTSKVSHEASLLTKQAFSAVGTLTNATSSIGDIVKLIQDIATQTNLLALNATIEASHAGEIGKGFTVVANEVKNLANKTARATEEIQNKINNLQSLSDNTTKIISDVINFMHIINDSVSNISNLTKSQNQVANIISEHIENTNKNTKNISQSINNISKDSDIVSKNISKTVDNVENVGENIKTFEIKASDTSQNASQTKEIAKQIDIISNRLNKEANLYKTS